MVQRSGVGTGKTVEDEIEFYKRFSAPERVVASLYQKEYRIICQKGAGHQD